MKILCVGVCQNEQQMIYWREVRGEAYQIVSRISRLPPFWHPGPVDPYWENHPLDAKPRYPYAPLADASGFPLSAIKFHTPTRPLLAAR